MIKRWSLENGMMLSDDCGQFVDIEDYERLKAERYRLRENISTLLAQRKEAQHKHAALVETANHAYSEWEGGSYREAIAAMEELKAALAEVKP